MQPSSDSPAAWLDRPVFGSFKLSWETVLLAGLLLLAVVSRFYLLEPRVMSHDETIHVYHNAYSLFNGQGYRHDPLSHGPFQFHLVALSYFLFGDNDLTARIPAVLFSIATVAFVWLYRRYLGKAGTLAAMTLMLISPYMLYYGRYVRNESFAAFAGVVLLWAMLRYLETGKDKYTIWVTAATVLHFTAKETAFIYSAQALLFLGLYFIYEVSRYTWVDTRRRNPFAIALLVTLVLLGAGGVLILRDRQGGDLSATQTAAPAIPGQSAAGLLPAAAPSILALALLAVGAVALLVALYFLLKGFHWNRLRQVRSFGLLVLTTSLVLPQLSAFPIYFMGWTLPTNATEVASLADLDKWRVAVFLAPMALVSIAIGLAWNWRLWLTNAAVFYGFFTILYTTVFTNGAGFFTGIVGSLAYWLKQQGVQRGSQPWYYYIGVQIPVYEYLPLLGSLMAFILMIFGKRPLLRFTRSYRQANRAEAKRAGNIELARAFEAGAGTVPAPASGKELELSIPTPGELEPPPVLALLAFWAVISIAALSLAGEKMPWLTVHQTWPMVLLAGWAIGYVIDCVDWTVFKVQRGWLVLLVLVVFLVSFTSTLGALLGETPPFQGRSLEQLSDTTTFITAFLVAAVSGILLLKLAQPWSIGQLGRVLLLTVLAGMAVLTARTAFQSSYINYDDANELLVYAHSAGGVKVVMRQVDEISQRLTDGKDLIVAHDGEYPFWWYLRHYPNARYYGQNPSRTLREADVIIAGDSNFAKLEPVVGQAYDYTEYIRLWWPNQDYFGLTWERIKNGLLDPQMRQALFEVWLNRDYTKYGLVTGKDMSLENWSPAARMRMYIRKDVAAKLWNYGAAASAPEPIPADPYEDKGIVLTADRVLGGPGAQPGLFQRPRDLALAPDGSLFVADTDNNRIQHLANDGTPLQQWGSFADSAVGEAPGGTFNQPWGIAVGPDGSVYVADTWNHRVQKFTAEGEFIKSWGYFGQAEQPEAFWGPRDVAVDLAGRVFVTDTGNKRVVIFDPDGNFLAQFGTVGMDAGQFDEPVGVSVDSQGLVYVADTWNQRIQVFEEDDLGNYLPLRQWEVAAWFGQSLDNKPYLTVDNQGRVFVVDPEGYRVLQFTKDGQFVNYWGDYGSGLEAFGLAGSVAADADGGVWVSDTGNGRLMHFMVP